MFRYTSRLAAILLASILAACGSLSSFIPQAEQTPGNIESVYVATVRARDADGAFTAGRSETITYMSYGVSVPPIRRPAQSPRFTGLSIDPKRDFLVASSAEYANGGAFSSAVATAGRAGKAPAEAFVYVHGFNTSLDGSVYQLAQIGNDINIKAARVLFAWPTRDRLSGYLHDTESVAFARSGLEEVLEGLAGAGVKRIVLVGYSMGAALVVETLRQMRLSGSPEFFSRLGGVVLLSPDIDLDVFRASAREMGGLPQPFIIYSSPRDGPLRFLATLIGNGVPRVGAPSELAQLNDLNLIFVDVSRVPQAKQPGHLPVATSPSMIAELNAMERPDLVSYALNAARGGKPGAEVVKLGDVTYVRLPEPGN